MKLWITGILLLSLIPAPDPPPLDELDWMTGHWRSAALGGVAEEAWLPAAGDAIHGVFRHTVDGELQFSEFMQLTEEVSEVVLRFRHFNPDYTTWEAAGEVMEFRLHESGDQTAVFLSANDITPDRLTYARAGDTLRVEITGVPPFVFELVADTDSATPSGTLAAASPLPPASDRLMNSLAPVLVVDEIEPAIPFWEALGFERTMEAREGERLGFLGLQAGDVQIMYQSVESARSDVPALAEAPRGGTSLFIVVDDLDAVIEGLGDADYVMRRRTAFYGADEVVVREPGGNFVTFAQFEPEGPSGRA
jgi:hypothetical protein